MTTEPHWAVCQIFSNRANRIRTEVERTNHGTFVPTYARIWHTDGKRSSRERELFPGYLFFLTEGDDWGPVGEVDGVCRVIANAGKISTVPEKEIIRLVVGHATGEWNEIEHQPKSDKRYSRRRRRPRPGKRLRSSLRDAA